MRFDTQFCTKNNAIVTKRLNRLACWLSKLVFSDRLLLLFEQACCFSRPPLPICIARKFQQAEKNWLTLGKWIFPLAFFLSSFHLTPISSAQWNKSDIDLSTSGSQPAKVSRLTCQDLCVYNTCTHICMRVYSYLHTQVHTYYVCVSEARLKGLKNAGSRGLQVDQLHNRELWRVIYWVWFVFRLQQLLLLHYPYNE